MTRLTSLTFLAAAVATVTTLGACAVDQPTVAGADELAGETALDGEQPKADAPHDNFGLLEVHGVANPCPNPVACTRYTLTRANRTTAICNDNKAHPSCAVRSIIWDKAGLSQAQADKIEALIAAEAADPSRGAQVLIKGTYRIYVDFLAFEVSEVWQAQLKGGTTDGTYVRISDSGVRCITTPCPVDLEERLNSNRAAKIDGLDPHAALSASLSTKVEAQIAAPDGAIVVGTRTYAGSGSQRESFRTVNQVFLPVK
jgi:hypothetical protein